MHASSANGHHAALPSREGWARILAGRLSPNGKTVRFDGPGDKPKSFSKTLTMAPQMPYGMIVEDPQGKVDWRELQAYVLDMAGIPLNAEHNHKNSGPRKFVANGHRPAGGSIVREAKAPAVVPTTGEGAAVPSFSPPAILDWGVMLRTPARDRVWRVHGLIPADNVTLLSGNGGEGKTYMALQLAHCLMWGSPWLGVPTTGSSTVYYSAEEDQEELTYRAHQIQAGIPFGDQGQAQHAVHPISVADWEEPALAVANRQGRMEARPMLRWLEEVVGDLKAGLLTIDAAADVFWGNEMDRGQVRSFIGMLRGICLRRSCAVLLLAHPSKAGMQDGSGHSGSTQWPNSVRGHLYLQGVSKDDRSLKQLAMKKTNRVEAGWSRTLRQVNGSFHVENVPDNGVSPQQRAKAKAVFLELLQKANDQDRTVNDKSRGSKFAPAVFEYQARERGVTKHQLELAMSDLFDAGTIKLVPDPHGRRDRDERCLVVVERCLAEGGDDA